MGHIWDDNVSSLMVPYGTTIELYDGDEQTGDSMVYQGAAWADSTTQELVCIDLNAEGRGWDDKTSSIRVWKADE